MCNCVRKCSVEVSWEDVRAGHSEMRFKDYLKMKGTVFWGKQEGSVMPRVRPSWRVSVKEILQCRWELPWRLRGKESTCPFRTHLSREDPLEKEMATHTSIPAWEIPWTEEPGGLQAVRLQRVGHDWARADRHTPSSTANGDLKSSREMELPRHYPRINVKSTALYTKIPLKGKKSVLY